MAAITAGCVIASAVLFAVAWQWSPPPRASIIALPPPPARQQEALDVIAKWLDAQNRSDVAGMQALSCAAPGKGLADRIATIRYYGNFQADVAVDAVKEFSEDAGQFKVEVAERFHPLDERMKQEARWIESNGGYSFEDFSLVDEGGHLKICNLGTNQG